MMGRDRIHRIVKLPPGAINRTADRAAAVAATAAAQCSGLVVTADSVASSSVRAKGGPREIIAS